MFVTVLQYEAGSFAKVGGSPAKGARFSARRRFMMAERKNHLNTDEVPGDDLLPPWSIEADTQDDELSGPGIDEQRKRPVGIGKAREGVDGVPASEPLGERAPDDRLPPVVPNPD